MMIKKLIWLQINLIRNVNSHKILFCKRMPWWIFFLFFFSCYIANAFSFELPSCCSVTLWVDWIQTCRLLGGLNWIWRTDVHYLKIWTFFPLRLLKLMFLSERWCSCAWPCSDKGQEMNKNRTLILLHLINGSNYSLFAIASQICYAAACFF